jgi:hypothetical protein
MKKNVVMLVLGLLLVTGGTVVAETDISGTLKTDLIWNADAEELLDEETFNLVIERQFGFDADLKVDLQIDSYRSGQRVVTTSEGAISGELPQMTRETEVGLNEAYVNYYTTNIDWKLGKQELNWGSAYKLQPTDYFSPQDLTDLDPLAEKIGIKAVQGTYYAEQDVELAGVVVPFFARHKSREVEQVKRINEQSKQIDKQLELAFKEAAVEYPFVGEDYGKGLSIGQIQTEKIKDKLENAQAGAKFTKRRLGDFDLSLTAYRGRDKLPVVAEKKTEELLEKYIKYYGKELEKGNSEPKSFTEYYSEDEFNLIVYPEASRVGFDLIGDLGQVGVWTELTYSFYNDNQFDDRLEAAVGADRRFSNDLYLVGQYYHREGRIDSEEDVNLINIYFDKPVGAYHEIEVTSLYEFETETYMIEPQFNYSLANSTVLEIGATYLENSNKGAGLTSFLSDDKVYTRLRVDF